MEVTQAEFARMAGVSRAAIKSKINSKTLILNSGGMLDTENPVNSAYLNKHHEKAKREAVASAILESQKQEINATFENQVEKVRRENNCTDKTMLQMTLAEIIAKYQDLDGVDRYVKVQKDLVTIEEKNQRIQEKRLQQLPRDFVIARLFGYQQQQASRILDVPESAVDQIIAFVRANPDDARQKIIEYLRDLLSRAIGGAKEHVINELNSLKTKYSDDQGESISDKIDALMEANQ